MGPRFCPLKMMVVGLVSGLDRVGEGVTDEQPVDAAVSAMTQSLDDLLGDCACSKACAWYFRGPDDIGGCNIAFLDQGEW